jgi:predicted Holliday junction resolvase-like endonuclease
MQIERQENHKGTRTRRARGIHSYDLNDLRALWDPIDFVAFNGIGVNRRVDSITFIDIKTRDSRLKPVQKTIKDAVEAGKVHFETIERGAS